MKHSITISKSGVIQGMRINVKYASKAFSVHKDAFDNHKLWNVTHLNTGYVCFKFKKYSKAREFIEAMEYQLQDWDNMDVNQMQSYKEKITAIKERFANEIN